MSTPYEVVPDTKLNMAGKDAEIGETEPGVKLRRWTRDEYYRAAEMGLFAPDERLELLNGVFYVKMGETARHVWILDRINKRLVALFAGENCYVRAQHPISLTKHSEPEPDITVVIGDEDRYLDDHPTPADILLLIEVSNTTLNFDRNTKKSVYSAAGIWDYWIMNVSKRCVEVHRDPQNGTYYSEKTYQEQDSIAPLAAPGKSILVADLLPRGTD